MLYVVMFIIGFVIVYFISKINGESKTLKEEPFSRKFKIFVDTLGQQLWNGQQFILMKKNERQFFIQKSKIPNNESHVSIIYRLSSLHLEYYENTAGVITDYKKTYNISRDITGERQKQLAQDFAQQVMLYGKIRL
ncbi:hypothetical protein [Galbibacter sp.]|uniref:hypothetical protein n=1 Tax=Galbibacter sp. TaxID=2918471 RepID=UPI003A948E9B